jgi:hypothetical protein
MASQGTQQVHPIRDPTAGIRHPIQVPHLLRVQLYVLYFGVFQNGNFTSSSPFNLQFTFNWHRKRTAKQKLGDLPFLYLHQ